MGKIVDVEDISYIYPVDDEGNEGDGMAFESCILDDEIVPPIKAYSQKEVVAMLTEIQLEITEKSYYDTTIVGNYEDEVRIYLVELDDVNEIIQQKIDKLTGE